MLNVRLFLITAASFSIVCYLLHLVDRAIGTNILSFVWLVIPMGALFLGALGGAGSAVGAYYINARPGRTDVFLAGVIAVISIFFFYYLEFSSTTLSDGQPIASAIPFTEYIHLVTTQGHAKFFYSVETGAVGQLGYIILAIKCLGAALGGAAITYSMRYFPHCQNCNLFVKKAGYRKTNPIEPGTAVQLIHYIQSHSLSAESFQHILNTEIPELSKASQQTRMKFQLMKCPRCSHQKVISAIETAIKEKHSKSKETQPYFHTMDVPSGVNLDTIFTK